MPARDPTSGIRAGVDPVSPPLQIVEPGFDNYAVLEAAAIHFDCLVVSPKVRRRAEFHWNVDGIPEARWVIP